MYSASGAIRKIVQDILARMPEIYRDALHLPTYTKPAACADRYIERANFCFQSTHAPSLVCGLILQIYTLSVYSDEKMLYCRSLY